MATQSGPKGDWHRTWQAIHHQSHVAISLYTASVNDLCVYVCVRVHVCMWVQCMCASLCYVSVPKKLQCPSRMKQKLEQT